MIPRYFSATEQASIVSRSRWEAGSALEEEALLHLLLKSPESGGKFLPGPRALQMPMKAEAEVIKGSSFQPHRKWNLIWLCNSVWSIFLIPLLNLPFSTIYAAVLIIWIKNYLAASHAENPTSGYLLNPYIALVPWPANMPDSWAPAFSWWSLQG